MTNPAPKSAAEEVLERIKVALRRPGNDRSYVDWAEEVRRGYDDRSELLAALRLAKAALIVLPESKIGNWPDDDTLYSWTVGHYRKMREAYAAIAKIDDGAALVGSDQAARGPSASESICECWMGENGEICQACEEAEPKQTGSGK